MKLALVLPLFSEYPLREYLGIELIYKALKENDYHVDRIDLNGKLVDYLLSNKTILNDMFLTEAVKARVQESPHSKYFERYLSHILKHDTAKLLKQDGLYDSFFRTVVSYNFDQGFSADESVTEKYPRILDQMPVIKDFFASFRRDKSIS